MIAERVAGHSGVKYLRSLGCERVQFKNQVCNPELGGLPAKSETLRLNSGVSWPGHGKRCRTAGFYSSVLPAKSRFRSGLVIVSSGLLWGWHLVCLSAPRMNLETQRELFQIALGALGENLGRFQIAVEFDRRWPLFTRCVLSLPTKLKLDNVR